MENVEETNSELRSDLSDWSGAPLQTSDEVQQPLRLRSENVEADNLDYTQRLYDGLAESGVTYSGNGYLPVGPSNFLSQVFNPLCTISTALPLSQALVLYAGLVYDSITVTMSVSAPKGIAGALIVGWFPHAMWDPSCLHLNDYHFYLFNEESSDQRVFNSASDSQLLILENAKDISFDIPWTFAQTYLSREAIRATPFATSGTSLLPGSPIIFARTLSARSVSSVATPAQFRLYYSFNNLRFVLPCVKNLGDHRLRKQSGLEPVMAGLAVDTIASAGAEILAGLGIGEAISLGLPDYERDGNWDKPSSVMMSYVGDTTSTSQPPTSPIFSEFFKRPAETHPVIDYLKKPQFIAPMTTNGTPLTFLANPVFPRLGNKRDTTWIRFFSSLNTFWRGTIIFDFVILGHDSCEVGYDFRLAYPPSEINLAPSMSTSPVLYGICHGTHVISVPMPFAAVSDYLPVVDAMESTDAAILSACASAITAEFNVINTMLDVAPVFDVLVFMRCGDDFVFTQPYAPGLNKSVSSGVSSSVATRPDSRLRKQVLLPPTDTVFETRARTLNQFNIMPSCPNIEDYMRMWSRALPFSTVTSGEPVVALEPGLTRPCWWSSDIASINTGAQNSWYCTNDYVSLLSRLFVFYRGSIAAKIVCDGTHESALDTHRYRYVELMPYPFARQTTHTPFSYSPTAFPQVNLGNGAVVTPDDLMPVLEVTVPYRSNYAWSPVTNGYLHIGAIPGYQRFDMPHIRHNITLQHPGGDLVDALFRKTGSDFGLAVETLMSPPALWLARGYDWT